MLKFAKAHAYGNDFLYVRAEDVAGARLDALAHEMCDRHAGVGADGLIVYEPAADEVRMRLLNADGSRAELSGNGVRALGALLLQHDARLEATVAIRDRGGRQERLADWTRGIATVLPDGDGFAARRPAGAAARHRRRKSASRGARHGQSAMRGPRSAAGRAAVPPDRAALERHELFPDGTNVEFAEVEAPDRVRILIWERGVGPTSSSGTGSCAALVAAASFGGAARDAEVVAPGGAQRVEWRADGVFLTGWAEVLVEGEWLRQIPRTDIIGSPSKF